MGNYSSVIREIRPGPSRYYKVSNMFCRQCMVKLHRVGYRNTETSKGNLPVNEIDKDVVNQMIDSWCHPRIYISGEVLVSRVMGMIY